jgi:3D (Asp-Asp-Asp) domain-containing protein
MLLLLTFNPTIGQPNQPQKTVTIVATAYCLRGQMTNGQKTHPGCIALSRPLAKDLGLKIGSGNYDYAFGTIVVLQGTGPYDGEYIFKDLMPRRWQHYRVDIWFSNLKECRVFGVKRCQLRVKDK